MEIYTIGFTKKTAKQFFGKLRAAKIARLIDVRLNNTSQLAGFTKRDDLKYFLQEICQADYVHVPMLAPSDDILSDYKKKRIDWQEYEQRYLALVAKRKVEASVDRALFEQPAVLLCSEATPENCHRRLAAEYLADKWGGVRIIHL